MGALDREISASILSSLPSQIAVIDRSGVIVATNRAWDEFARENDASEESGVGVGANYLAVCQADRDDEHARLAADGIRAVLSGQSERFEIEYPCHSPTEERYFLLSVTPMKAPRDSDARGVQGAVVAHVNITQRIQSERRTQQLAREVAEERRRLEDMLDHVPGVVWEMNGSTFDELRLTFISRHVQQMLGLAPARWYADAGMFLETVHPSDRVRTERGLRDVFETGRRSALEFRWVSAMSRPIWVASTVTVVQDASGRPTGLRGVAMDVSRRKQVQRTLRRRANALIRVARQLKRSNEELDQFAYVTSHDLRAPLRGIQNLSKYIEEDLGAHYSEDIRSKMELLRGRVNRMRGLIDGLLEYSRVGRVVRPAENVDVGVLLDEIVDFMAFPPSFKVEIEPQMPTLCTERLRLDQVFMNLIGNAYKHGDKPEGRVRVTSRRIGGFYEFAVSDNGPGIDPKYHEKIFGIFQTLEARDKHEGTGIGLALARKIVESQGGTITVDSAEGQGATFRFTWPVGQQRGDEWTIAG